MTYFKHTFPLRTAVCSYCSEFKGVGFMGEACTLDTAICFLLIPCFFHMVELRRFGA